MNNKGIFRYYNKLDKYLQMSNVEICFKTKTATINNNHVYY